MSCISLLCEGVVDWDAVKEACQQYAAGFAGALFGVAWWVQADNLIVQQMKGGDEAPVRTRMLSSYTPLDAFSAPKLHDLSTVAFLCRRHLYSSCLEFWRQFHAL